MSRALNKVTEDVCNKYGSILIDLDSELDMNREEKFYNHCHYTPTGSEKIGKYLLNNLHSLFWLWTRFTSG